MAILGGDSFDHYRNGALTDSGVLVKWDGEFYSNQITLSTTAGRFGTTGLHVPGWQVSALIRNVGPLNSIGFGFALNPQNGATANVCLLRLIDNTTAQVDLWLRADYLLEARRGDGTVLATSAVPIPGNTFSYIEFFALIDPAVGVAQVRVNEVMRINYSGNTQMSMVGQVTKFHFGAVQAANGTPALDIDDFIYWDTSGPIHNTFLGDVHLGALLPDADGPVIAWTPSAGANYQCVDEIPPNDDTDYVESSTATAKDLYHFPDIAPPNPGMTRVVAVLQNIDSRKTSGGLEPIQATCQSNSVNYDFATTFEPGALYHITQQVWETDPNTGVEWTLARLNDANAATRAYFGQKLP